MDLAVKYGADVAIFLHNLVYWVEKNAANQKNFHDGRYWTYNTMDAFARLYPLWSRDQIKRIIKKCEDLELVVSGDYNEQRRDRTKWYSPSDEILELYGLNEITYSKWRNRQMPQNGDEHLAESPAAFGEIATALPSIYQEDTITPLPPTGGGAGEPKKTKRKGKSVPSWEPERFETFWEKYPRDEDRAKAAEEWDKLPKDKELMARHKGSSKGLLDEVARGLGRHLACDEWKRGVGIPYAFRWLRGRKWLEKQNAAQSQPQPAPVTPRPYHMEIIDGEEVVVFDDA